jgi:SOS-response transcriptional repressor LexA
MGRHRDDPEKLSPRQQEWLDAARRHIDRTGEPPSRIELVVAMGCVSKGSAAYVLRVLERKGRLVRVYKAGRLRYLPADRAGDAGRSMTAEQVADWVREVDDRTLALLRDAIEADVGRREQGTRPPGGRLTSDGRVTDGPPTGRVPR